MEGGMGRGKRIGNRRLRCPRIAGTNWDWTCRLLEYGVTAVFRGSQPPPVDSRASDSSLQSFRSPSSLSRSLGQRPRGHRGRQSADASPEILRPEVTCGWSALGLSITTTTGGGCSSWNGRGHPRPGNIDGMSNWRVPADAYRIPVPFTNV